MRSRPYSNWSSDALVGSAFQHGLAQNLATLKRIVEKGVGEMRRGRPRRPAAYPLSPW